MMLEDVPPSPCPSMNADSIHFYIQYKVNDQGEAMLDASRAPMNVYTAPSEGESPCESVPTPLKSLGGWKDPGNISQMLSAVRGLHAFYGNGGNYQVLLNESLCVCHVQIPCIAAGCL
jgi:hypothetical protein